jgi:hypothetical protein
MHIDRYKKLMNGYVNETFNVCLEIKWDVHCDS